MTFPSPEYERWMETAREDLRVARHDRDGGFHHAAVLYAEQAAQCALKALLHGVGKGELARGHGILTLLRRCREHAALEVSDDQAEALAELARNYLSARYPDALPEGTPQDHYGADSSERAISTAQGIVRLVERGWRVLQEADGEGEDE